MSVQVSCAQLSTILPRWRGKSRHSYDLWRYCNPCKNANSKPVSNDLKLALIIYHRLSSRWYLYCPHGLSLNPTLRRNRDAFAFVFLRQSAGLRFREGWISDSRSKARNRRASCLFDNKREVRQVIKIWWGFPERVVSSFYEGVSRMTTLLARTCRQLLLPFGWSKVEKKYFKSLS